MRTVTLIAVLLSLTACFEKEAVQLRIENSWIPEIPPVIRVAAGYMEIHNESGAAKYLVGASSDQASSVEVHKSTVVGDIAKMERQREVEIPAGGQLTFSNETGYHLMFYGAKEIRQGNRVPVTLEFKDGSSLTVMFDVVDRRELE